MRDLAIVTLNYNGSADTIECIESIYKSCTQYSYNIYVLDNDSSDTDKAALCDGLSKQKDFTTLNIKELKKKDFYAGNTLILSTENLGFAKGNNSILETIYPHYRYVLLLNNDTVVSSQFIQRMIEFLDSNNEAGFVSCRIDNYYEKNVMWNCGGKIKPWGVRKYYSQKQVEDSGDVIKAEFITGCALFIRSSIIAKYGMLTNQFFFGEEDFNFCWRMKKAGIIGKCLTKALVLHKVSRSSDKLGQKPGKLAGYYVVRIVDMRQFYPFPIWVIWKRLIVFIMGIKWYRMGFSAATVKNMKATIHHYSNYKTITREDILKVWSIE